MTVTNNRLKGRARERAERARLASTRLVQTLEFDLKQERRKLAFCGRDDVAKLAERIDEEKHWRRPKPSKAVPSLIDALAEQMCGLPPRRQLLIVDGLRRRIKLASKEAVTCA